MHDLRLFRALVERPSPAIAPTMDERIRLLQVNVAGPNIAVSGTLACWGSQAHPNLSGQTRRPHRYAA